MVHPFCRRGAALTAVLLLAACQRTQVDLPATVPPEPALVTAKAEGFEGRIAIDGLIASVPRLHELIEPRMRATMAEVQVASQADIAARGGAPQGGYFFDAEWTGSGAGARYLNVRGRISQFTGGAHPLMWYEAFVWDRLGQRRLALADLLRDPRSGSPAVSTLATLARDALIAVKHTRMPDYDPAADGFIGTTGDGPFAPDLARFAGNFQLVPRGAGDAAGEGGIELLFSPYEVGPWAEGGYEVLLPAAAVRPLLKADAAKVLE